MSVTVSILFVTLFMANFASMPLVMAQHVPSVIVHPGSWTILQGGEVTYYVIVSSFDRVTLSTQSLPPGISVRFNPSSGQSITGQFLSTLTVRTQTSTPPGAYSLNLIVSTGRTQVRAVIRLMVVPRTTEGARLVLYGAYAKYLSPMLWMDRGLVALASFSSNFGTSFTDPFSLLKKFIVETNELLSLLSTAYSSIKIVSTMVKYMMSMGMSSILSFTYPGIPYTSDWEIEPLVKISSLIERGNRAGAVNELRNLLPRLRTWLRNIENYRPDGLVVTNAVKEAARNLVLSCINFLEAELMILQDARPPSVTVVSPNGGETLVVGRTFTIRWMATDDVGVTRVDIYYSTDGGRTWRLIAEGISNTGSYSWVVPNAPSTSCLIRIDVYDVAGNRRSDTSDRVFTIRR